MATRKRIRVLAEQYAGRVIRKQACVIHEEDLTSALVEPDSRPTGEACLYRHDSLCRQCVERCVNEALFEDTFNRQKCYEACLKNEELFKHLGKADVCGKCLVGVPCSFTNPVKQSTKTQVY